MKVVQHVTVIDLICITPLSEDGKGNKMHTILSHTSILISMIIIRQIILATGVNCNYLYLLIKSRI